MFTITLASLTLIATSFFDDPEIIKFWGSMGAGGLIAGMIFYFYRKDVSYFTSLWKGQAEQLTQVVKENTAAMTANTQITQLMYEHLQHTARGNDDHPFSLPDRRERPRG